MARLSLTCRQTVTSTATGGGAVEVDRRVLVRTGGHIDANTTIDINDPGPGWTLLGVPVTFSGSTEFTESTQVYRNGEIQLTGASASTNNDVYFVAVSGSIAFEMKLHTNDVVQVWNFSQTTTSG
jgi:hypothetical protein